MAASGWHRNIPSPLSRWSHPENVRGHTPTHNAEHIRGGQGRRRLSWGALVLNFILQFWLNSKLSKEVLLLYETKDKMDLGLRIFTWRENKLSARHFLLVLLERDRAEVITPSQLLLWETFTCRVCEVGGESSASICGQRKAPGKLRKGGYSLKFKSVGAWS